MDVWDSGECEDANSKASLMSHVQIQILDRAVTILTGLETTGSKVFRSRLHPLTPATMPGLCISLGAEGNIGGTMDGTSKAVKLNLGVVVEGDDTVLTGSALAEIEAALYADIHEGRFFNGLAFNLVYFESDRQHVTTTAVQHTRLDIVYRVEYQTQDGDAETAC